MTHKERKEEVRKILALDTDELVKRAKGTAFQHFCLAYIDYCPFLIKILINAWTLGKKLQRV